MSSNSGGEDQDNPDGKQPGSGKKPSEKKGPPKQPPPVDSLEAIGPGDGELPSPEGDTLARLELRDRYSSEFDLNSQWYRWMRAAAFVVLMLIALSYFCALLVVLKNFTQGNTLVAVLGVPGGAANWHSLVLVGIIFIIFSAIPLSLSAALLKMVSEQKNEGDSLELKTPSTELGKMLYDVLKGLISKMKE